MERRGLIQRDIENSYLNLPVDDEDSLLHLQGASVSYRVTIGPNQGQKVFTLQTVPQSTENEYGQLAKTAGFSLHAGVFADTHQTDKLERLCRYISRPAISEARLSMTDGGKVRYELKTNHIPQRDSEQKIKVIGDMDVLRSGRNFHQGKALGQQFGCYQRIRYMAGGLVQVKSTLWKRIT